MYLRHENSRLKENLASIEERLEKLEKAVSIPKNILYLSGYKVYVG